MMTMQNTISTLSLGARLLTVGALLALFMAAWLFSSISSSHGDGGPGTATGGVSATELQSAAMVDRALLLALMF